MGLFMAGLPLISAVECGSVPTDGCTITQNTTFTQGTYNLPNGIGFDSQFGLLLDCNGATLIGSGSSNGITLDASNRINIKNCMIKNYSKEKQHIARYGESYIEYS